MHVARDAMKSKKQSECRLQPNDYCSDQTDRCPLARDRELEASGNELLKDLSRIVFLRRSLDLRKRSITVTTQWILIFESVVDILKVLQSVRLA